MIVSFLLKHNPKRYEILEMVNDVNDMKILYDTLACVKHFINRGDYHSKTIGDLRNKMNHSWIVFDSNVYTSNPTIKNFKKRYLGRYIREQKLKRILCK